VGADRITLRQGGWTAQPAICSESAVPYGAVHSTVSLEQNGGAGGGEERICDSRPWQWWIVAAAGYDGKITDGQIFLPLPTSDPGRLEMCVQMCAQARSPCNFVPSSVPSKRTEDMEPGPRPALYRGILHTPLPTMTTTTEIMTLCRVLTVLLL
jgi:hypothetical protein